MIITLTATVMKRDDSVEILYEEDFKIPENVAVKLSDIANHLDRIGSAIQGIIINPDAEPNITIPSALTGGEFEEED